MRLRILSPFGLALFLSALPSVARADAPPRDTIAPDARPDPWAALRRPWLYSADPTAPPPGHVLASLGVGYAGVDRGAAKPFAANQAHAGAVMNAGAEVGVLRFMTVQAEGLLSGEGGGKVNGGAMIGLAFYPLPRSSPVDLAIAGGYLRELGGGNGMWARVSAAANVKDLRFVLSTVGSHVFEPNRDEVDILITAGATYAILPILRVGVEYAIQDLEGIWDPEEAEGGVRHFVGPTASMRLAKRVYLTAGPAFGLSKGAPNVLGRVNASYAF
jgi:hypothetical protein